MILKRLATVKSHCSNRQYVCFTTLFILLSLSQLFPRILYISSLSIIQRSLVRSLINHLSQITINHFNMLKYAIKHYTTPPRLRQSVLDLYVFQNIILIFLCRVDGRKTTGAVLELVFPSLNCSLQVLLCRLSLVHYHMVVISWT